MTRKMRLDGEPLGSATKKVGQVTVSVNVDNVIDAVKANGPIETAKSTTEVEAAAVVSLAAEIDSKVKELTARLKLAKSLLLAWGKMNEVREIEASDAVAKIRDRTESDVSAVVIAQMVLSRGYDKEETRRIMEEVLKVRLTAARDILSKHAVDAVTDETVRPFASLTLKKK